MNFLVTAKESVSKALTDGCTSMGPYLEKLEAKLSELTGYKHIICMTNGSMCLLSLMLNLIKKENGLFFEPNRSWL